MTFTAKVVDTERELPARSVALVERVVVPSANVYAAAFTPWQPVA